MGILSAGLVPIGTSDGKMESSRAVLSFDPHNVEGLTATARDIGDKVHRGLPRYSSETGGWQLGDLDLDEYLARYRDQKLVLIIAAAEQLDPAIVVRAAHAHHPPPARRPLLARPSPGRRHNRRAPRGRRLAGGRVRGEERAADRGGAGLHTLDAVELGCDG